MSKRSLQGTKAQHKKTSQLLMDQAHNKMKQAQKAIDDGRCTVAYMNVVELWEKIGESNANGYWAGQTALFNQTDMRELGYEFSTKCLRDTPTMMGRGRKTRKRK
jgi:hypothetical protein